ncbi:C3 and PZP-like alpha-2-macroglobulin domain-containing protein 8 [Procambarus clarkii]|uniref:C3 and PZP-like alpha-2-macroglobulin domain-containing protein 8 n=1 Tax=Procambarus clarkii TaxID=6728 RepID=UPI0037440912
MCAKGSSAPVPGGGDDAVPASPAVPPVRGGSLVPAAGYVIREGQVLRLSRDVRAEKPDGTPAGGVPMEVCAAGRCTNMTTAPDGLFTTVLPVYNTKRVYIKALNSRANMHQSEFSKTLEHSSLPLLVAVDPRPGGQAQVCAWRGPDHLLPVLFSASDQTSAIFTVQVVSRGKVQYQGSQEYQLTSGELPISVEHLVEPLPPPLPNTIRGVVNININIPPTASPKVKVLVWYTRQDGEVVADSRELEVDKCLSNTVNLTWSASRVQPGEQASLSLSSEPDSVCSLGVVDRSTELLAVNPDPISLEAVFNFAGSFDVGRWPGSQIDDYKYCEKKRRKRIAGAKPESSNIEADPLEEVGRKVSAGNAPFVLLEAVPSSTRVDPVPRPVALPHRSPTTTPKHSKNHQSPSKVVRD